MPPLRTCESSPVFGIDFRDRQIAALGKAQQVVSHAMPVIDFAFRIIGNKDRRWHRIEYDPQFRRALALLALAFHERALHALALGDIVDHHRQRTTLSLSTMGAKLNRHIHELAVLVLPDRLAVHRGLAFDHMIHDLGFLVFRNSGIKQARLLPIISAAL